MKSKMVPAMTSLSLNSLERQVAPQTLRLPFTYLTTTNKPSKSRKVDFTLVIQKLSQ